MPNEKEPWIVPAGPLSQAEDDIADSDDRCDLDGVVPAPGKLTARGAGSTALYEATWDSRDIDGNGSRIRVRATEGQFDLDDPAGLAFEVVGWWEMTEFAAFISSIVDHMRAELQYRNAVAAANRAEKDG